MQEDKGYGTDATTAGAQSGARRGDSIRRFLAGRKLRWLPAMLALLLTLPALWTGLWADDYFHQITLTGIDPLGLRTEPDLDIFAFLDGNPESTHQLIDAGVSPWWTLPEIKASFFRPLAALSHWLDYQLWPGSPELMHLHSLLWFAALVVAVGALYRQTSSPAWIAGLAALLYALDDARGLPVAWLANRNALIAGLLGVLALTAHIRWRRHGWRRGAWLAPLLLMVALTAAEAAIAVGAYLAAHALILDRGSWWQRLLRLVPYGIIIAGWWTLHHWLGYGTSGSGFYTDPSNEPLQFVQALVVRAPILLLGQLGLPSSSYFTLISSGIMILIWWLLAVAVLLLLGLAVRSLLRTDRVVLFWATGMVLSVIPICATFPHDRLLIFTGLGGMGLIAHLVAAATAAPARRRYLVLAAVLVFIHLVWAPLNLPLTTWSGRMMGRIMEQDAAAIPDSPQIADQDLILVNPCIPFLTGYTPIMRWAMGLPIPAHTRMLATGTEELLIERLDEQSLLIRPHGGFISGAMDTLMRAPWYPMQPGQRIELTGMTIEVTELTVDGRPAAAIFHFDRPLEDPSLIWFHWQNGYPIPFTPPAPATTITLDAQVPLPFHRLF